MAESEEQDAQSNVPFKLFMIGFLLMFAGVVVLVVSALVSGDGTISFGGIVFVGPIPIVLGAGPYAFFAVVVAAVLTVIGFVMFWWLRRQLARG